jgi:hypothetical protein
VKRADLRHVIVAVSADLHACDLAATHAGPQMPRMPLGALTGSSGRSAGDMKVRSCARTACGRRRSVRGLDRNAADEGKRGSRRD